MELVEIISVDVVENVDWEDRNTSNSSTFSIHSLVLKLVFVSFVLSLAKQ